MNEQTPKRAAIYARSATINQQDSGPSSIEQQIEACRQYCAEHGYTLDEQYIYQEVYSGAQYRERPQLTALRVAAGDHEFDALVIFAFDRLARKSVHQTIIIDELTQAGVTVESVQEQLGGSAIGQFLRNAHAFMQEIETEQRGKRIKRGKRIAQEQREQS